MRCCFPQRNHLPQQFVQFFGLFSMWHCEFCFNEFHKYKQPPNLFAPEFFMDFHFENIEFFNKISYNMNSSAILVTNSMRTARTNAYFWLRLMLCLSFHKSRLFDVYLNRWWNCLLLMCACPLVCVFVKWLSVNCYTSSAGLEMIVHLQVGLFLNRFRHLNRSTGLS